MKGKQGFILIEVLLGTAIAGMIFAALFAILNQSSQANKKSDNMIAFYERISLVRYQLTRDIASTYIPAQADIVQEKIKAKQKKPAKPAATAPQKDQKKIEAKPDKTPVITNIFNATNKESNLNELTLITNNPMQVYWSDRAGKAKPRIARVVYRLVPDDQEGKQSFKLTRQEDYALLYDKYKKDGDIRAFDLIDGIRSLSCTFMYAQPKVEKKSAQQKDQVKKDTSAFKAPEIEWKEKKEWESQSKDSDAKKTAAQKQKPQMPVLPHMVQVDLELWDMLYKKSRMFTFTIPLASQQEQQIKQAMIPFAPPAQPTPAKSGPKFAAKRQQRTQLAQNNRSPFGARKPITIRVHAS